MDPFKTVSNISIPTIVFGVLVLVLGWLVTATGNPLVQLQLGEAALVFLSLFFYSLTSDKAAELEEKMKIIAESWGSSKAKLVP
jgi:ABC-type phosphate transport system permease subunit